MRELLTILFIAMTSSGLAQQGDESKRAHDPRARERIQAARVAHITDQLALTPQEAEKFWPVYRELTEKRMALRKQYRNARHSHDPKKTQEQNDTELIELRLSIKQKELDLEKEYSAKLLKIIPAEKLKNLPEAEQKFRSMVLHQIERRHKRH